MTSRDADIRPLIPIGEAARRLGISVDTLRRWADDGRVDVVMMPSGHRRFRPEDIRALLAARRSA